MSTTTVSAILRSNQAYHAQLSDKTTLQWGIAYTSPRYPNLMAGNEFREVMADSQESMSAAYEAVEEHFARAGVCCRRWTPAAGLRAESMEGYLASKGYCRRDLNALRLTEWVEWPAAEELRILPGRAMRKALRGLYADAYGASGQDLVLMPVQAALERLDDPQTDAFVAMAGGGPVGCCTVFQVGDIIQIVQLWVREDHRRQGVGTALLSHVLQMCRRLAMRVTCAAVPRDNAPARNLALKCGFAEDGRFSEFVTGGAE